MIFVLILAIIQLTLFIISCISWVLAKVLFYILVIYALLWISKAFRVQKLINPAKKAVLITGCDSGFGHRLALRLNSMGYRVYATVLSGNSASVLIQNSEHHSQMVVFKMDVTVDEDVDDVYTKVIHDLEATDCILWSVVNNAGYGILAPIEWCSLDEFRRIFEVNVFGMVRVTKRFLPLIRSVEGRIVNLSSQLGLSVANGAGAYCMTKHAVTAFNNRLRQEMAKFGVNVSALYPVGYSDTNLKHVMTQSFDRIWNQTDDYVKSSYGEKYPEQFKAINQSIVEIAFSKQSDQVIDCLIHAITNCVPKRSYEPGDFIALLVFYILKNFPNFIIDKLDCH